MGIELLTYGSVPMQEIRTTYHAGCSGRLFFVWDSLVGQFYQCSCGKLFPPECPLPSGLVRKVIA